jgi:hypothetical protein
MANELTRDLRDVAEGDGLRAQEYCEKEAKCYDRGTHYTSRYHTFILVALYCSMKQRVHEQVYVNSGRAEAVRRKADGGRGV